MVGKLGRFRNVGKRTPALFPTLGPTSCLEHPAGVSRLADVSLRPRDPSASSGATPVTASQP